jgi:phage-related protein
LATKTAILAVKIVSDAKDFTSKMDQSVSKMDKFQNAAKKLTVPAAAVLTGLGAIALGSGKMASEAEQNFGAVDAVFKDHAKSVKDMAKTSATNLGLSGSDYAKYSALLGSQLKNAGVPLDQLSGQTNKLIGYGADFAAQFGGSVPEAVDALSSALKGEMDPIEKYGISLSETKVKAQMAADGTDKLTGAAYDQAKAAAIMTLIQNQGKDAMGAFGREAGTAAGQQAIATAKWQDASAALGNVLLPIMTQAASVLADMAKWVQENIGVVQTMAVVIAALAAGILILNGVMMVMNIIAAVNPWVILAVAVVALIGVIVWLATQTTFFQDVWAAVASFATTVWTEFTRFVGEAWNNVVNFITGLVNNVGNFFASVVKGISNAWNAGFNFIRGVVGNVINFIVGVVNNVRNVASSVANAVGSFFANGFNYARNVAVGVINGIVSYFGHISNTAGRIISWVQSVFASGFNYIYSVAAGVINGIVGFFGRISGAVSNAIAWVRNLFNMGGMPGWLKGVLGMGGTGFEISAAFAAPVTGEFGIGATGGGFIGSRVSGGNSAPVVNNYSIVVNGALDPVSVGKQLKKIVNSAAIRDGSISAGGSVW